MTIFDITAESARKLPAVDITGLALRLSRDVAVRQERLLESWIAAGFALEDAIPRHEFTVEDGAVSVRVWIERREPIF